MPVNTFLGAPKTTTRQEHSTSHADAADTVDDDSDDRPVLSRRCWKRPRGQDFERTRFLSTPPSRSLSTEVECVSTLRARQQRHGRKLREGSSATSRPFHPFPSLGLVKFEDDEWPLVVREARASPVLPVAAHDFSRLNSNDLGEEHLDDTRPCPARVSGERSFPVIPLSIRPSRMLSLRRNVP